MRARRKPLIVNCWHNSTSKRPDGGPPESMPPWVRSVAEKEAAPGKTFLIQTTSAKFLVPTESVVYQAPDGSLHAITVERFKTEYEPINVAAPAQPEGEKK